MNFFQRLLVFSSSRDWLGALWLMLRCLIVVGYFGTFRYSTIYKGLEYPLDYFHNFQMFPSSKKHFGFFDGSWGVLLWLGCFTPLNESLICYCFKVCSNILILFSDFSNFFLRPLFVFQFQRPSWCFIPVSGIKLLLFHWY